jgi:hypothetical protein
MNVDYLRQDQYPRFQNSDQALVYIMSYYGYFVPIGQLSGGKILYDQLRSPDSHDEELMSLLIRYGVHISYRGKYGGTSRAIVANGLYLGSNHPFVYDGLNIYFCGSPNVDAILGAYICSDELFRKRKCQGTMHDTTCQYKLRDLMNYLEDN